ALDRKKLAAFSALGGGFLRFPIGDRRASSPLRCAMSPGRSFITLPPGARAFRAAPISSSGTVSDLEALAESSLSGAATCGWGTPASVGGEPGGTSASIHGLDYLFSALRREGLIADELVLQLATFLRSLDLFLELTVRTVPRTLTTNQVRRGGKQGTDDPELSRIHSRTQHPRDKRREASAHGAAYWSTSARLFFVLRADVASACRTAGSGAGSSAAGSILVSVSWRRKSAESPA